MLQATSMFWRTSSTAPWYKYPHLAPRLRLRPVVSPSQALCHYCSWGPAAWCGSAKIGQPANQRRSKRIQFDRACGGRTRAQIQAAHPHDCARAFRTLTLALPVPVGTTKPVALVAVGQRGGSRNVSHRRRWPRHRVSPQRLEGFLHNSRKIHLSLKA